MGPQRTSRRTWIALPLAGVAWMHAGCAARSSGAVKVPLTANLTVQEEMRTSTFGDAQLKKPLRSDSGGAREGIRIHGYWTIEVRDADGTVVSHNEFENALTTGQWALAPMLGRAETLGLWSLFVAYGVNNTSPCTTGLCLMVESSSPQTGTNYFHTLTLSAPLPGDPAAGTLTLQGSFTPQIAGAIGVVGTLVNACAPTVAPANCLLDNYQNNAVGFSGTTTNPINLTVGQLVLVRVVYSFS